MGRVLLQFFVELASWSVRAPVPIKALPLRDSRGRFVRAT